MTVLISENVFLRYFEAVIISFMINDVFVGIYLFLLQILLQLH